MYVYIPYVNVLNIYVYLLYVCIFMYIMYIDIHEHIFTIHWLVYRVENYSYYNIYYNN